MLPRQLDMLLAIGRMVRCRENSWKLRKVLMLRKKREAWCGPSQEESISPQARAMRWKIVLGRGRCGSGSQHQDSPLFTAVFVKETC